MNALGIALLAFGLFQDPSFTKDDVLKLSKAGIGEEVILAKIEREKGALSISADDLAELKKAGVGEKVIARLTELTSRPAESSGSDKGVAVRNVSHRAVRVSLKEADRIIDFSTRGGTELPQGGSLHLAAPPGEYSIAIEGWPTTQKVGVAESGSSSLTVRGADTDYIDVQTIVAEDADGRRVVILHNQGKIPSSQRTRPVETYAPTVFYGPEWSYYPYVRNTVLVGAGVGAIIGYRYARHHGHHHGHRSGWGWYGGVFVGCGRWR
ncbi:MAG TPA: hypothetical protein VJU16_02745 [Planctomycetota bacterium]|nr:hypothetical protein [Planctomycetota bacterium]